LRIKPCQFGVVNGPSQEVAKACNSGTADDVDRKFKDQEFMIRGRKVKISDLHPSELCCVTKWRAKSSKIEH